jgi:hypothetical protein
VMGSVVGTGEDSGNNPPQKTHARTVRICTGPSMVIRGPSVVVCRPSDWVVWVL